MEKKRYNAGQVIFNVGDAADGLYLIASGSVGVYFPGNLSSNKPDITLKETEIIGEMGVIDAELRLPLQEPILRLTLSTSRKRILKKASRN